MMANGTDTPAKKRGVARGIKLALASVLGCVTLACLGFAGWYASAPYRLAGQADAVIAAAQTDAGRGRFETAAFDLREYLRALSNDARAPDVRQQLTVVYELWIERAKTTGDLKAYEALEKELERGPALGIGEWTAPRLMDVQTAHAIALMQAGKPGEAAALRKKMLVAAGDDGVAARIRADVVAAQLAEANRLMTEIKTRRTDVAALIGKLFAALDDAAAVAPNAPELTRWQRVRQLNLPKTGTVHYLSKQAGPLEFRANDRVAASLRLPSRRSPSMKMEAGPLPPGLTLTWRALDADYTSKGDEAEYTAMDVTYTLQASPALAQGAHRVELDGRMAADATSLALGLGTRAGFGFVVWVDE